MAIKEDPKRPGTFIVQYSKRHPTTRMPLQAKRIGVRSKSEARRVFNALVIQVENKIRAKCVPTWPVVVRDYLEACRNRGLSERTIYSFEKCLGAHVSEPWEKKLIDETSTSEIREMLQAKLGSKGPSYQKYFLRMVRSVFNHAVEMNALQKNPTPVIKFKLGDKIKGVLTVQQATKLLDTARDIRSEWYAHWSMALYTGMRNGELYALTWDKVDLENQTIVVDTSWNNLDGFKSTKSGDDRVLEIAPGVMPILRELKAEDPESEFVLPRLERWDRGRQAHDLRMFLAGLGLPQIRFHDLRATWATMLLGKGVEPIKVMSMGGWKDMETMMIYARKAGIDIRGSLNDFSFHRHQVESAKVINLGSRSDS